MRSRLMVAIVGLVALVLVIAGAGSLLLSRASAREQATQQLTAEARSLALGSTGTQSVKELADIRRVLKLEDARFVRISRAGLVASAPPQGVPPGDLDPEALLAGQTVTGRNGDLVFAAAPVQLTPAEQRRLAVGGAIAVVLTRQVGGLGPSWAYFALAGAVALLVAALMAWHISRRMVRPLVEARDATGKIAAGDLEQRVPVRTNDYPELSALASSINEMAQSLADSRRREQHLLSSVSHDLRTPLTSIRGFAEAIVDGAVEDKTQAAAVIIAEARRLERLVGDLLTLTTIETNRLPIAVRPADLADVVITASEGFLPMAERRGIRLEVRARRTGLADVAVDPDRLAQLLANLIENAIGFANSAVVVSLYDYERSDKSGARAITVEDDGPGIPPDDLARVFERFYQSDRGRGRRLGSGLGLAIVAELATAMGIHVRGESPITATGGTRFVVTL